ncbi:MAG: RDD family protein, partial [Desulfobacterales bacterium]
MTDRVNTLIIKTPEGVEFSLRLAGPITRFLAWSIDLATIIAMMSIINVVFAVLGVLSRDLAAAANIIGFFIISIGYGILTEWYWQGQTVGKKLLRLRVLDAQGL